MRNIFTSISIFVLTLPAAVQAGLETRKLRCINKTPQTIALFDAHGGQILIAPHMSNSVTVYPAGAVVWMVTSAAQQAMQGRMFETNIRSNTSRLVFSQTEAGQIICTPELNVVNWLAMRAQLSISNFASGLSFGIVSADDGQAVYEADQGFCNNCFYSGVATTALLGALTAYKINTLLTARY